MLWCACSARMTLESGTRFQTNVSAGSLIVRKRRMACACATIATWVAALALTAGCGPLTATSTLSCRKRSGLSASIRQCFYVAKSGAHLPKKVKKIVGRHGQQLIAPDLLRCPVQALEYRMTFAEKKREQRRKQAPRGAICANCNAAAGPRHRCDSVLAITPPRATRTRSQTK